MQLNPGEREKVPPGLLHNSYLTHIVCYFKQKSAEKLTKRKKIYEKLFRDNFVTLDRNDCRCTHSLLYRACLLLHSACAVGGFYFLGLWQLNYQPSEKRIK